MTDDISRSRNETSSPRRLSGDRLTEVIAWADTNASAFSKFPHSEKSPADSYLWMLCLAVLDLRDDVQEALRSTRSETERTKHDIQQFAASIVPPPGYVMEQFDITNSDQVVKMGAEFGAEWSESLMPLIKALQMEQRIVFFPALIGNIVGHMCAAIGSEATQAVLDMMKMSAHFIGERNERKQ